MRLQILELPATLVGSAHETRPFILVASEVEMPREAVEGGLSPEFREQVGASGVLITPEAVEIGPA